MKERGRVLCFLIAAYLLAKSILNLIIGGFAAANWISVLLAAGFAAVLILGIRYTNYIVAALTALIALRYFPGNLRGLPGTWLYLTEGIIDFAAAGLLIFSKDILAHMQRGLQAK
ncbi:MAG: hypothetical protein IJ055_09180 [Oscillospiraceae bacterium]|nr:hypothetical protein [Oscillospiraceae bacterium]